MSSPCRGHQWDERGGSARGALEADDRKCYKVVALVEDEVGNPSKDG